MTKTLSANEGTSQQLLASMVDPCARFVDEVRTLSRCLGTSRCSTRSTLHRLVRSRCTTRCTLVDMFGRGIMHRGCAGAQLGAHCCPQRQANESDTTGSWERNPAHFCASERSTGLICYPFRTTGCLTLWNHVPLTKDHLLC